MPSRRTVLTGTAAMLAAAAPGPSRAGPGAVRFGVIADPQYADAPPNPAMNRYYANSLGKLEAAIAALNAQDLDFVVSLGDLIDRDRASFARVLAVYARLRHPHAVVLGNHDFSVSPEHLSGVPGLVGLARAYHDFAAGGVRFVALDGNDVSLFAPPVGDPRWPRAVDRLDALRGRGALNAKPWNGGLDEAQWAWFEARLAAAARAGERVVVLNHYPAFPENPHNLWDAERMVALLARQPHVLAYLNGHNHAGNHGEAGGVHYVTFRGMVDTPDETAFAVVEIADGGIAIQGFGREPSRRLRTRTA